MWVETAAYPRVGVPTRIEAALVIHGEEQPYARFTWRDIEFDQPVACRTYR